MSHHPTVSPPVGSHPLQTDTGSDAGEDLVARFIEQQLAEQRDLRPVEAAARLHDTRIGPSPATPFRDLIPLSAPRPGEQYAFEIDLDRCSGCKGCVTACHSLNGLDDGESWRSVGLLTGAAAKGETSPVTAAIPRDRIIPLQQTVTTACHHCLEPACLHGCPVLAYDKDPVTGIVRHLDDQCIGCSYCILKCPYEVPRYSARRGIVRKCDLCHGRLAAGEAPACVQACPNEAIRVTLVRPEQVRARVGPGPDATPWLPDSPSPSVTLPTTRYISRHPNHTLLAADHHQVRPAHPHWPLVWMLTLTQVGLGGWVAAVWIAALVSPGPTELRLRGLGGSALALLMCGLVASVFHLGQPTKAWRVWLGWRRSWLSREAMVLNLTAGICLLSAGQMLLGQPTGTTMPLLLTVVSLAAVGTQIMVYVDTGRHCWRLASTAPRFFGTFLIAAVAAVRFLAPGTVPDAILPALVAAKLAVELSAAVFATGPGGRLDERARTALLLRGPLRTLLLLRLGLALTGLGLLLAARPGTPFETAGILAAAIVLLPGEVLERLMFFSAASPNRMPGLPR